MEFTKQRHSQWSNFPNWNRLAKFVKTFPHATEIM